jgi:hypothetical protein
MQRESEAADSAEALSESLPIGMHVQCCKHTATCTPDQTLERVHAAIVSHLDRTGQ